MNLRIVRRMPLLLLPFVMAAAPSASPPPTLAPHGDYVEARTASVFAGACHYNGERVTEGRSAVLAWRIAGGSYDGVDLAGVEVLATVAADDNLAERAATRRSEVIVDADTDARAAAATAWLDARCGDVLGSVVSVHRAPVAFARDAGAFSVSAPGFASLSVRAMPDAACCSQPELVWYQPLMAVLDRRVGYTESASATSAGIAWNRADENSAFYGRFDR